MSREIHLARFGNRGGAHDLLAHTGGDTEVLGKIVWHTDAPPDYPSVVEPFASGYRLGDTYILQLTRPDDSAARPGMVATTAAIIPIPLLDDLDLRALLSRLAATEADLRLPLCAPALPAGPQHHHPPGAGALASALITHGRAAWVGSGLVDAISCVWTHVTSPDRSRMVFGSAYHPQGLSVPTDSMSIVVVAVPARAVARWRDRPILDTGTTQEPDPARDALFGHDAGRAAALVRSLDLDGVSLRQWRHLAAAAGRLGNIDGLNHESTRALLQLLGHLQPASNKGEDPKRASLSHLAKITPTAGFADIRGLRGVPWQTLPPTPSLVDLLTEWARTTLPDPTRGPDVADAVAEAEAGQADEFRRELTSALQNAADRLTLPPTIEAVLGHARGSEAMTWLVRHAGSRSSLDAALAEAAGALDVIPEWVVATASRHGLPCTHATCVDVSTPAAAWRAHLRVTPRARAAEDILTHRTGAGGTVRAALQVADATLADRAGRLVAGQSALLDAGEIADEKFLAVWAAATRHGADPWRFISSTTAAEPLLTLVANGQPVDPALIEALSRTSAADLSRYPDRARLWNHLPSGPAARFKLATAAALARSLRPADPTPEPQLQNAILTPDVLGTLAHDDPSQAVTILRLIPSARQEHAELVASRGRFSPKEASELAGLVVDYRWKRAAETIADLANRRADLRAAAGHVGQLFSPIERLRRLLGISDGVRNLATADELRDAVYDIACALYPDGPVADALWERAGGNNADLPDASNGRHRWGLALDAITRGRRGTPALSTLLDVMVADYPNNHDLRLLSKGIRNGKTK